MMKTLERVQVLAKGFCMGAADVVPGVSGGTMALILGIYTRLLRAIKSFDLDALRYVMTGRLTGAARHVDLGFLVPLGVGILAALLFFTRVVKLPTLIKTHPEAVYGLFFGLVLASLVVLAREIGFSRWRDLFWAALGLAGGLAVVNLVPVETPETAWFVFLSGALAICAMILPGISGSFILLILQKYAYVFDAIGRLDLTVIMPFGAGAVIGLMMFSRVLTALLNRFYRRTLAFICGVLAGSLWVIWPFQQRTFVTVRGKQRLIDNTPVLPEAFDGTFFWALGLAIAGFLAVLTLERWGAARATAS